LPLIADNIVVFLFRLFERAILRAQSRSWKKIEATIRSAKAQESMYPFTEVAYTYKVNLERYSGKYKRGFWYNDTAKYFARYFVPSEHIIIRVCPDHPEKSYVFEEDQSWCERWLRRIPR
jgi:hypothetical protein